MEKSLLIDLGHLSHRYLFTNASDIKVVGYGLLRYRLCSAIFNYMNQFKPDRVYIGVDYKKSWRKVFATFYKEHREENRKKSSDVIDWSKFYEFMESFVNELKENFPFYVPLVPHLEADDVIGYITRTLDCEMEKIIVTGDSDYVQLLKHPNTRLWSPCKNAYKGGYVTDVDPEEALMVKIICGDKSDNIPGCRPKFGEKKALKAIKTGEIHKMLAETDASGNPCEMKINFERNKKLIDMEQVPVKLLEKIDCQLNNYNLPDGSNMFQYFIDNKLVEMIDNIERYRILIKPLISHMGIVNKKVSLREIAYN